MADEENAPRGGAGRTIRRTRSMDSADISKALPCETTQVEDTISPETAGASLPVRSTKRARTKRVVPITVSTRLPRMMPAQFKGLDDPYEKISAMKGIVNLGTGLALHLNMGDHECLWDPKYPECPARFYSVIARCDALGLLDRCIAVGARNASKSEILRVHTENHFKDLNNYKCYDHADILEAASSGYDAIFIHPCTYKVACLAAGSVISLVDAICTKVVTNGIAIVRPPGHHAMEEEFNGYCFFNNVAIAARHAIETYNTQRILIVDWDVHHGQGTQQLFYQDKRVLYFSIHRYEYGSFWPNLAESDVNHVGDGPGKGFNVNVPLNQTGLGNTDFMAIFQKLLLPIAYEFQPTLVFVSAGYDAAIGCPEGEMAVTPVCFSHLLWSLKGLAQGNIAVVLEGGYYLKSLSEGVAMTLRSLLDDPCPMMDPLGEPAQVVKETIVRSIVHLHPYWKCLQKEYQMGLESTVEVLDMPIWPSPPKLRLQENRPPFATRDCYPVVPQERTEFYDNLLNNLIEGTNLATPLNRVCYVYEPEMANYADNSPGLQVESPNRIIETHRVLEEFGLIARSKRLKGTPAQPSDILLAHEPDYLAFLKKSEGMDVDELEGIQGTFNSVILKNTSYASMMLAVGCLLNVVDEVCSGSSRSGVAVIRPPGHHAEPDRPCGFCLVNNVAVAAKHAQTKFNLKRVLVLDWDVHHGNGTQRIFYDDPSVLYISIHRYDGGRFFPSSPDANSDKVGVGKGEGYNVNIPWSSGGMHDGDYLAAFTKIVMPIAYEFNPELVIVSAGFDAAINDPLGRCCVTPEAYGHLTHLLMPLAAGRVILALEGGYNVNSVATCMASCMRALLGDPLPDLDRSRPSYGALKSIYETTNNHGRYWKSMRIKNAGANARQIISSTRIFALKHFGKEYDQLDPNDQLTCFRSLMIPTSLPHLEETDANTIISQFLNLNLYNKSN